MINYILRVALCLRPCLFLFIYSSSGSIILSISFPGLHHLHLPTKMIVPLSQAINKYLYQLLVVCCLAFLIYYATNHFVVRSGVQIKATGKTRMDNTAHDEIQSTTNLHKLVNPETLNKLETEQLLRDSINDFHFKNFNKPPNEVCKKRPPSAIVIGVEKSGTRELVDFMHLHPHIQFWHGQIYEMNYFYQRHMKGIKWLINEMPCSFSNQITIMKQAGYFHNTNVDVSRRIRAFNASIKLILIVREPISRAYSAYTFQSTKGLGYKKSFNDLIMNPIRSEEQNRPKLLKMSIYDESMERWLKVFNLSQILIIEHNEFKHEPFSVLVKVEEFLGLGHYITPDMFVYNTKTGFHCIRSNRTSTGMACYASDRGRTQKPISPEIKSELTEFFKPKNERFFRMIGKSFDW